MNDWIRGSQLHVDLKLINEIKSVIKLYWRPVFFLIMRTWRTAVMIFARKCNLVQLAALGFLETWRQVSLTAVIRLKIWSLVEVDYRGCGMLNKKRFSHISYLFRTTWDFSKNLKISIKMLGILQSTKVWSESAIRKLLGRLWQYL